MSGSKRVEKSTKKASKEELDKMLGLIEASKGRVGPRCWELIEASRAGQG